MTILSPIVAQVVVDEDRDCGQTNVCTDDTIPNEDPLCDDWFIVFTWWLLHNIRVGWVEGEGGGR